MRSQNSVPNFKNGNVACLCLYIIPMSLLQLKKCSHQQGGDMKKNKIQLYSISLTRIRILLCLLHVHSPCMSLLLAIMAVVGEYVYQSLVKN